MIFSKLSGRLSSSLASSHGTWSRTTSRWSRHWELLKSPCRRPRSKILWFSGNQHLTKPWEYLSRQLRWTRWLAGWGEARTLHTPANTNTIHIQILLKFEIWQFGHLWHTDRLGLAPGAEGGLMLHDGLCHRQHACQQQQGGDGGQHGGGGHQGRVRGQWQEGDG